MNALLVFVLLGQTANETILSDSIGDGLAQPPVAVETSVDEGPALPALEATRPARPSSRGILAADSPATRPRATTAIVSNNTPRATVQPAASAVSRESQYATSILEGLLAVDEQSQPKIRKVKLVEAVSKTMDVQSQATAIGAYWDVALHIGRLRFAQDKVAFLSSVPAPNDLAERAVLESELATADVVEAAAQDELLAAQYRLMRSTAIAWNELLPWPADVPLVGAYRTNYDTFFANRPAPLEIKLIHQSLPGKLKLIERSATAVYAAETATDALMNSYKQNRSTVAAILDSTERLERARHAFLTAVVDYNDRIAEYSLAAVGQSIGPETLVTTLIKSSNATANLATIPNDVHQANGETPTPPPFGATRR